MRKRIVRRFLWSAFVLLAISLLGVDLYVTRLTSSNEIEDLRAALTTQALLLAAQLPAATPHFDTWVKTRATESRARVTVLDREGTSLADSGLADSAQTAASDDI